MLDTKGLVLLSIYISCSTASEYIISSDGWVPVTSDQVYNVVNFVHTPLKSHSITSNTIKLIKTKNGQEKESNPHTTKLKTSANTWDFDMSVEMDNETSHTNSETVRNATEYSRKAKQINEQHAETNADSPGDAAMEKYDTLLEEDIDNKKTSITPSNTYEVEEDTYNGEDLGQDNLAEGFGYNYSPPVPPPPSQNLNFSSSLINILSKYNINTDDQLPNYDLSRRRKVKIPITPEISNFPKVLSRHRYNSLNHLPVDPLLAVFLSNYGFYIPSLYGIKSNYNNLYGYLASNNIHNNRPFGLYKIFSDTDSWN